MTGGIPGSRVYTDLCFHPPARQSATIASPRAIAVIEMTHQIPALPHWDAAHAANGMREMVIVVEATIGATVCPAPPSAPSNTISAQIASCEMAAMRRYLAPSAITAGSFVKT